MMKLRIVLRRTPRDGVAPDGDVGGNGRAAVAPLSLHGKVWLVIAICTMLSIGNLRLDRTSTTMMYSWDGGPLIQERPLVDPATITLTSIRSVHLDLKLNTRYEDLGIVHLPSNDTNASLAEQHFHYLSQQPVTSQFPWPNLTTLAHAEGGFDAGYRNQIIYFTMAVFEASQLGHGQLLLPSFAIDDHLGTNQPIPFAKIWDVGHWNKHYPDLPRLVDYDPILHSQFILNERPPWRRNGLGHYESRDGSIVTNEPVRPHSFYRRKPELLYSYKMYVNGRGSFVGAGGGRNHMDILIQRGALRPHRTMQAIIDKKKAILLQTTSRTTLANSSTTSPETRLGYMYLHARVEPDMQRHMYCRDRKVRNLTDIFQSLENKWPDPPCSKLMIAMNRPLLEQEGNASIIRNELAAHNLQALNRARVHGLWNGRVKTYEFGTASIAAGSIYQDTPGTPGAVLDFFLGVDSQIFVGTEVSTFSVDVMTTRFFRGNKENYKFLPEGIFDWTPPELENPEPFGC